ncbi:MAG: hypothetical protein DKM50_11615 [Candidatus Margulisiibacteriota bacterium]|nr:MAG: hypothetical protein A2X43_02320 [Candidatus Margulisbacteria bacterium GWD2_39_127]OGI01197.1 MAG: hypothetical protein A2X42_06165 [Candidatus Margulisbacteria bacterium GWF2_38_17]OGI09832.1 MAG: hypothetical protein A2X41_09885 [Candidatus Margulisbacteria bacterium GWE2_39_32]PZM78421.1 MAG: hypothetical protein DKM50_11615 [Candidatus Margulisiibacteriota bacterium]HAR62393.1 hypothetical protein [Candidatus Margulisiibacteriota bacterium]
MDAFNFKVLDRLFSLGKNIRCIAFLMVLLNGLSYAEVLHISYDGKPIEYYNKETKKYFVIVNNSSHEENVSININDFNQNNGTFELSAKNWSYVSTSNLIIPAYTKKTFNIEICPYPFLSNKEYYATVIVSNNNTQTFFPVIVLMKKDENANNEEDNY